MLKNKIDTLTSLVESAERNVTISYVGLKDNTCKFEDYAIALDLHRNLYSEKKRLENMLVSLQGLN